MKNILFVGLLFGFVLFVAYTEDTAGKVPMQEVFAKALNPDPPKAVEKTAKTTAAIDGLVQSEAIPQGFRIPAQDRDEKVIFKITKGRRFYVLLKGTPPAQTGKPLQLRSEYINKQLEEWGFHGDYELTIAWVSTQEFAKTCERGSPACFRSHLTGDKIGMILLRTDNIVANELAGFGNNLSQYYSSHITTELRRVYLQQSNSPEWKSESGDILNWAWKRSKYNYFAPN